MKKKLSSLLMPLIAILLLSGQLSAQTDVNGLVLYHFKSNKPIPAVNLSLVDSNGLEFANTTTALNGSYTFAGVPDGTYTLKATTEISAGGITMGDAFLMLMHLCNIYPFTPIQKLAADVDGDENVTWNDYWTVIIGWFIQGYPFPAGPWTFQDVTFTLNGSKTNVPTMGGSSSGDVNGTFVPATREIAAINATYTEKKAGNDFSIEIFANDISETSAMG
ncbi:MAG: hypothetical protein HGA37_15605, partial [Lentimicrobium sp.]|nr:hypothetical protein [Lentimicrobium sp.]